jgi:hypothetical protein
MQKTLLSSTEDQPGYQPDEFGSNGGENRGFGCSVEMRYAVDPKAETTS